MASTRVPANDQHGISKTEASSDHTTEYYQEESTHDSIAMQHALTSHVVKFQRAKD